MFIAAHIAGFRRQRLRHAAAQRSHFRTRLSANRVAIALAVTLSCIGSISNAAVAADAARPITIHLDRATLIRIPVTQGSILIDNPIIARVTHLPDSNQVILTGLSYGETRLTVFGSSGEIVASSKVLVSELPAAVTIYRGQERDSYSDCSRLCQPHMQLGDADKPFGEASGQIRARENKPAPAPKQSEARL